MPETDSAETIPPPAPSAAVRFDLLRSRLKLAGGAIASVAAVGAVVGGLTGYWNAWKTVRTDILHGEKAATPAAPTPALTISKGPAVAVLPLTNAAGAAFDAIADGMTQQLTSSLGKFSTLRVTPRATSADFGRQGSAAEAARKAGIDYLVTGDLRPLGEGLRANFQVADLRTGAEIWSRSFDAGADSVRSATAQYEIGDSAASQIGGYPAGAIQGAEYKKIQGKPASELSAYECIVQALGPQQPPSVAVRSRTCVDALVQKEPSNALAWAVRSSVLFAQRFSGFGLPEVQATHLEKRLNLSDEAASSAARAVELAPDDPYARFRYAYAVAMKCQPDLFKQEADRALALNPNDPHVLGQLGIQLAFEGDWDAGAAMAEKAIRLTKPNAPYVYWYGPAKRHYWRGEYQEAYEDFRHAYVDGLFLTHLDQAYTLPFLGRLDDAKAEVANLLKLQPDFTIREADAYYRMFCFQPAFIEKMNGALRRAALPE